MDLEDFIVKPFPLEIIDDNKVDPTISEDEFHQVKHMFQKVFLSV